MRMRTVIPALLAGFLVAGAGALSTSAPVAAQGSDELEVFGSGQRGWFEPQRDAYGAREGDWYGRGAQAYGPGRPGWTERRDEDRAEIFGRGERGWFGGRPEVFGERRRGWFEERERVGRQAFEQGYRMGQEEARRRQGFGAQNQETGGDVSRR